MKFNSGYFLVIYNNVTYLNNLKLKGKILKIEKLQLKPNLALYIFTESAGSLIFEEIVKFNITQCS